MTQEMTKFGEHDSSIVNEVKKQMDQIYSILSKNPSLKSIKTNKYANNSKYLEIGYIESQLDRLFLSWDWEVLSVQLIANGIVVNGKLTVLTHNMNRITRSGVAGVEIQTKQGATSLNVDNMSAKAMDRDPGRAEAYALKNAAAKLGNAFGRSLNRDFKFEHIADESITDRIFNNNKTEKK